MLAASRIGAQAAAQRMVSEKAFAADEAAMLRATGATTQSIVSGHRRQVRENHRRLSRVR